MHAGEDVGKEKSPLPAGRSEDWCTHCGNQYGGVSKAGNIGTKDGAEVKKPLILLQRAGVIPSTHMVFPTSVTPVPGYLIPSSGLWGYSKHVVHMYTCRQAVTHIK